MVRLNIFLLRITRTLEIMSENFICILRQRKEKSNNTENTELGKSPGLIQKSVSGLQ